MISRLLWTGLGTMGSSSVKTYKDLAKQLGDYYLAGPQLYVNRLAIEIEAFQKDGNNCHYKEAANILVQLRALVKRQMLILRTSLIKIIQKMMIISCMRSLAGYGSLASYKHLV